MVEEGVELEALQFAGLEDTRLTGGEVGPKVAFVYERQGIPAAVGKESAGKLGLASLFEELAGGGREEAVAGVGTHAAVPVLGVGVVRFAAVHQGVDPVGIGMFQVLDDAVGGLEVVVPEQDGGADGGGLQGRPTPFASQIAEGEVEGVGGLRVRAHFGAQSGRLRGVEKGANAAEHGRAGEGGVAAGLSSRLRLGPVAGALGEGAHAGEVHVRGDVEGGAVGVAPGAVGRGLAGVDDAQELTAG